MMREVAVTVTSAGGLDGATTGVSGALSAARPPLIRAMNEQLLIGHIRDLGPISRADLARLSGLSKPTVSLALATVERAGLVRVAGQRTGVPGRSARLYEVRPDAGYVLGLDIGHKYIRGALADLAGGILSASAIPSRASSVRGRVGELIQLADELCARAGIPRQAVTQTVIGTPGVYDPPRTSMALTGGLPGWDRPAVLADLRTAFGQSLVVENDVDAAALAERTHGHGRDADSFAFVSVGSGIGMGLVVGGRLHRGRHGVAGEIAYLPISGGQGADPGDARRRGPLEAAASAPAVVRAARRAGMRGQVSARRVFEAAAPGGGGARPRVGVGGARAGGGAGPRRGGRGSRAGGQGAVLRGDDRRPGSHRARRRGGPGPRFRRPGHPRARADPPGHAGGPGQRAGQ